MEINREHVINLDGFTEQPLPYQCPECREEMHASRIIGFGKYPKGGYHANMKPNKIWGVGFECPKCFEKSCFHADEWVYKLFVDTLKVNTDRCKIKINNKSKQLWEKL